MTGTLSLVCRSYSITRRRHDSCLLTANT